MKKIILMFACISFISLCACKKDRVCECTNTYTNSSGTVTTEQNANVTYTESKRADAKSLCQKSTKTHVSPSGATSTEVNDCKLK